MYKPEIRNVPLPILEWGLKNNLSVVRTFLYLKFQGSHVRYSDKQVHSKALGISERTFQRHLSTLSDLKWVNRHLDVIYLRSFQAVRRILGSKYRTRLSIDKVLLTKQYFNSWFFSAVIERMTRYYESSREVDGISRLFLRSDASKCRGIDISVRYIAESFDTSVGKVQRLKAKAISQGAIAQVKNAYYVSPEDAKQFRRAGLPIRLDKNPRRLPDDFEGHYIPQPDTLVRSVAFVGAVKKKESNPDYDGIARHRSLPTESGFIDLGCLQAVSQFKNRVKRKENPKFSLAQKERLRAKAKKTLLNWMEKQDDLSWSFETLMGFKLYEKQITLMLSDLQGDDWFKYFTVKKGVPWATFNLSGRWAFRIDGEGEKDIWLRPLGRVYLEAMKALDYHTYQGYVDFYGSKQWMDWAMERFPSMDFSPVSWEERVELWTSAGGFSTEKEIRPILEDGYKVHLKLEEEKAARLAAIPSKTFTLVKPDKSQQAYLPMQ